jgi:hypothetical protein
MSPLEALGILIPASVGVLFTAGFGIPALVQPANPRLCFIVGGGAAGVFIVMVGYFVNAPLWQRSVIVGLFGAIASIGTTEAIRWAVPRPPPSDSATAPQRNAEESKAPPDSSAGNDERKLPPTIADSERKENKLPLLLISFVDDVKYYVSGNS